MAQTDRRPVPMELTENQPGEHPRESQAGGKRWCWEAGDGAGSGDFKYDGRKTQPPSKDV